MKNPYLKCTAEKSRVLLKEDEEKEFDDDTETRRRNLSYGRAANQTNRKTGSDLC